MIKDGLIVKVMIWGPLLIVNVEILLIKLLRWDGE